MHRVAIYQSLFQVVKLCNQSINPVVNLKQVNCYCRSTNLVVNLKQSIVTAGQLSRGVNLEQFNSYCRSIILGVNLKQVYSYWPSLSGGPFPVVKLSQANQARGKTQLVNMQVATPDWSIPDSNDVTKH